MPERANQVSGSQRRHVQHRRARASEWLPPPSPSFPDMLAGGNEGTRWEWGVTALRVGREAAAGKGPIAHGSNALLSGLTFPGAFPLPSLSSRLTSPQVQSSRRTPRPGAEYHHAPPVSASAQSRTARSAKEGQKGRPPGGTRRRAGRPSILSTPAPRAVGTRALTDTRTGVMPGRFPSRDPPDRARGSISFFLLRVRGV